MIKQFKRFLSLEYKVASKVAFTTLKNPPVNALSLTLLKQLSSTLDRVPLEASALMISSEFPNVFSAGLDIPFLLKKDAETDEDFETRLLNYINCFQECVKKLLLLDIPTATVISGSAPAGGTVLAFCTDYRIASSQKKFAMGLNEVG